MAKTHRTSRGDAVDMDALRLKNESTIAIGNAKTNARGDQLGHGGKVIKTRAQIMQEYHRLNTAVADESPIGTGGAQTEQPVSEPVAEEQPELSAPQADDTPVQTSANKPRGSFADAVAEETKTVEQELLQPASSSTRTRGDGISRI